MELSSPPKPIRIVDCLIPDVGEGTVSPQAGKANRHHDDDSEEVDEVSQMEAASLPALAGEVAVAQKQQISELTKKQEILDQLKVSSTHIMRFIITLQSLNDVFFSLSFLSFILYSPCGQNQEKTNQGKVMCISEINLSLYEVYFHLKIMKKFWFILL